MKFGKFLSIKQEKNEKCVKRLLIAFFISFLVIFLDQFTKYIFLNGFEWQGTFFDLYLVLNKGVSFSMFAFLGEYLKYIQLLILLIVALFLIKFKSIFYDYFIAIVIIFSAGFSNIFDRFIHGGVVDFFAWHYGFKFAIFNVADVFINIGVFLIILQELFNKKSKEK